MRLLHDTYYERSYCSLFNDKIIWYSNRPGITENNNNTKKNHFYFLNIGISWSYFLILYKKIR